MKKKVIILLTLASLATFSKSVEAKKAEKTAKTAKTSVETKKTTAETTKLSFDKRYSILEDRLKAVSAKDVQRFEVEKAKASQAQSDLDQQLAMREVLSGKLEEAEMLADVKYYSNDYKQVVGQYKDLLSKLDASIAKNEKIISDYEELTSGFNR